MGIGFRDNQFCGSRYMACSLQFKQQVPNAWVDCGRLLHATMCYAAIAVESLECMLLCPNDGHAAQFCLVCAGIQANVYGHREMLILDVKHA